MLSRTLVLVLVAVIALVPGSTSACTDAGQEAGVPGPVPFDAGPGCFVELRTVDASCGGGSYYSAVCPLDDAGTPDMGTDAAMCHERQDGATGASGERYRCGSDIECGTLFPGMTCGGDGFCVCPLAPPPRAACSIVFGRSHAGALRGLLWAALVLVLRRTR